jgi:hypothetical protein
MGMRGRLRNDLSTAIDVAPGASGGVSAPFFRPWIRLRR